jgi:hypothetical protein
MKPDHPARTISGGLYGFFGVLYLIVPHPLHAQLWLTPDIKQVQIAYPIAIAPQDLMDGQTHSKCPPAPTQYIDGTKLYLTNDETHPPQGEPIDNLLVPEVYKDILILIKKEKAMGKHLWHELITWNYCHYRAGKRNWFGWRMGEDFHWVLWKGGRFWWHDPVGKRWLSYYKGYWWWQSAGPKPSFQVLWTDGKYYTCDDKGILKDWK